VDRGLKQHQRGQVILAEVREGTIRGRGRDADGRAGRLGGGRFRRGQVAAVQFKAEYEEMSVDGRELADGVRARLGNADNLTVRVGHPAAGMCMADSGRG
jgi:hypothetical protein